MSPTTVYVISGANRGIGLAIVRYILSTRSDAFVYAGARDPSKASDLNKLKAEYPGRLDIVKLISSDAKGNKEVAEHIAKTHGRVDTVIANAAICSALTRVELIDPAAVNEHFNVNVTGTIVLFQAIYSLLKKSSSPRFIVISSSAGSLSGATVEADFGAVAYGSSKAAVNWVTRKIHFENEWLTAFPMCPGPVITDMFLGSVEADTSGVLKGLANIANTPENAAERLINIIDSSTREKDGGQFTSVTGERITW